MKSFPLLKREKGEKNVYEKLRCGGFLIRRNFDHTYWNNLVPIDISFSTLFSCILYISYFCSFFSVFSLLVGRISLSILRFGLDLPHFFDDPSFIFRSLNCDEISTQYIQKEKMNEILLSNLKIGIKANELNCVYNVKSTYWKKKKSNAVFLQPLAFWTVSITFINLEQECLLFLCSRRHFIIFSVPSTAVLSKTLVIFKWFCLFSLSILNKNDAVQTLFFFSKPESSYKRKLFLHGTQRFENVLRTLRFVCSYSV